MQERIAKRGENAGKQVVKEAHERAAREERLIREMEARKACEEQQKLTAMAATKAKMQCEVDESRRYQLQLRAQLKQENAKEEGQLVSEVRNCCFNLWTGFSTRALHAQSHSGNGGPIPMMCRR